MNEQILASEIQAFIDAFRQVIYRDIKEKGKECEYLHADDFE